VATRVFTDAELERLRSFPEINPDELIRFFTLTKADVEFVDPGRGRGPTDRLGLAVQLCTLPWLGFVPDEVTAAPPAAVARLSQRLGIPMGELRGYGAREQTRTTHLGQVVRYLKWKVPDAQSYKELDEFLLARAMEHDSPSLLFRLACEHLSSSMIVRPGPVALLERVASAREAAKKETHDRYAHLLTPRRMAELDGLLIPDPSIRTTRLKWLTEPPVSDSPERIKAEIAKLQFLRAMDAHTLDLSMVPAERRRERLALLDEILPVLVDVGIPDDEVGGMLRGLGLERLRGALATAVPRLPRDHGHLAMLDESYAHLRRFTPEVLAAADFRGGAAAAPLLEAVAILKELNAKRCVPPAARRSSPTRPPGNSPAAPNSTKPSWSPGTATRSW
jgi:hypothetical protein